jgi:hypothetical protein
MYPLRKNQTCHNQAFPKADHHPAKQCVSAYHMLIMFCSYTFHILHTPACLVEATTEHCLVVLVFHNYNLDKCSFDLTSPQVVQTCYYKWGNSGNSLHKLQRFP